MPIKVVRKGVYVRERNKQRSKQKVWRVEEVTQAIQVKAPLAGPGYELYGARSGAKGALVKAARLGPAKDVHADGAARHKNMDKAWLPEWELEIVQKDDPGWLE